MNLEIWRGLIEYLIPTASLLIPIAILGWMILDSTRDGKHNKL